MTLNEKIEEKKRLVEEAKKSVRRSGLFLKVYLWLTLLSLVVPELVELFI